MRLIMDLWGMRRSANLALSPFTGEVGALALGGGSHIRRILCLALPPPPARAGTSPVNGEREKSRSITHD